MSISWLYFNRVFLKRLTLEKTEYRQDLSILLLLMSCKSILISVKISIKKNKKPDILWTQELNDEDNFPDTLNVKPEENCNTWDPTQWKTQSEPLQSTSHP